MQSVSSRIWTRVAVSIPYDDSHYTAGTSYPIYIRMSIYPIYETTPHIIVNIFF